MKIKTHLLVYGLIFSFATNGQDTNAVAGQASEDTKTINHEIGFNTVSLLSQIGLFEVSNNQLPYVVFYNLYYKDKIGARLGIGLQTSSNQTEIVGELLPTISNSRSVDLRFGVSYNFARYKKIVINTFADFLWGNYLSETITTSSGQVFPDPVILSTHRVTSKTRGSGAQAGLGIKWQMYKNLALYAELPLTYFLTRTDTEDLMTDDGGGSDQSSRVHWDASYTITLPSTIYLVLRF